MSLNAKYRGKKPEKYFKQKYGTEAYPSNEGFTRSIPSANTELEETFLAYWEYSTPVLGDYHYDSRTLIPHPEEASRTAPNDQHIYDIKTWWYAIKFKSDIQIQLEHSGIDWIDAIVPQNMTPPMALEHIDKYVKEALDQKALTQSMHIQKLLFNKNLKKAIDEIPDALLCWTCIMLPYWVNMPHKLSKQTTGKELITHLLCRYKVADCLVFNLLHAQEFKFGHFITFFILGQGGSIFRLGAKFDLAFPKGFVKHMDEVSETTSIPELFMYTYVRSLGGSVRDFDRLKTNPFYQYNPNMYWPISKFKEDTMRWLIAHSDALTDQNSTDILDWAAHIYTERCAEYSREEIDKLKFWRSRGLAEVIRASQTYKQNLKDQTTDKHWPSKHWNWEYTDTQGAAIVIKELCSSYELYLEAKKMRHCVSLYWKKCLQGQSALFSMTIDNQKSLTIELDPESKRLKQARGKCNRSATTEELELLNLWLDAVVMA